MNLTNLMEFEKEVVFQIANRPFAQHFEEGFEQEVNNIKQQALLKQITLVETR